MVMTCILKNGRFGPYLQYEKIEEVKEEVIVNNKKENKKKESKKRRIII